MAVMSTIKLGGRIGGANCNKFHKRIIKKKCLNV